METRSTKEIAEASLDALVAVEEGQHADRALNEVGKRFRLRGIDRLAVKNLLHHTLRWRSRFDAVLKHDAGVWANPICENAARLALSSGFTQDADPELLTAISATLAERGHRRASRQLISLARNASQLPLPEATSSVAANAETYAHPEWMVELFAERFPEDYPRLLAANNTEPPTTLRVNPLKTTPEALQERLRAEGVETEFGSYSPLALRLTAPADIFRTAAFQEGLFEMQDEGSQLIGWVADPKPRGLVIDACAGAGGKTLLLAGLLKNRARILSVDIYDNKLTRLRERARRAGVSNMQARVLTSGGLEGDLIGAAEAVLVDAPCSGLGALRRNPDSKWRLQRDAIDELAARQYGILSLWAQAVKPGGLLVYSTCTLTHQENEAVVEKFLMRHPEFTVEPACARFFAHAERFQTPDGYFLALPHRDETDGFFAARLRRNR